MRTQIPFFPEPRHQNYMCCEVVGKPRATHIRGHSGPQVSVASVTLTTLHKVFLRILALFSLRNLSCTLVCFHLLRVSDSDETERLGNHCYCISVDSQRINGDATTMPPKCNCKFNTVIILVKSLFYLFPNPYRYSN